MAQTTPLAIAQAARKRLDWRTAAVGFTAAADAVAAQPNPHQTLSAAEIGLRRDAHLALCRTVEFQRHRERSRSTQRGSDFQADWRAPSGDLVRNVLGNQLKSGPVVRQRESVEVWA